MDDRADGTPAHFDSPVASGRPVLKAMTCYTHDGRKSGRLDRLGHEIDAIGQTAPCGHLKDRFGQPFLVANRGRTTRQDDSPNEVLGESPGVDVLVDFLEQFARAFVDDHFEHFAVHDGGGSVDGALEFYLGRAARRAFFRDIVCVHFVVHFPLDEGF